MRILIKFKAFRSDLITSHYNYPFNAVVYKILNLGSKEFAAFLHDKGYAIDGKTYKLFTFAVRFEKFKMESDSIRFISPNVSLIISSPLDNDFFEHFIKGTFDSNIIDIKYDGFQTKLEPVQIEELPEPEFTNIHKIKMLSPLILSTKSEHNGKFSQHYIRCNDDLSVTNRILNDNLFRKYKIINNKEFLGERLSLSWDVNYINRVGKKAYRLVRVKVENRSEIFYRGIMAPFVLEGSPELIRIGYQCGFGEKNSMGFGMVDLVR